MFCGARLWLRTPSIRQLHGETLRIQARLYTQVCIPDTGLYKQVLTDTHYLGWLLSLNISWVVGLVCCLVTFNINYLPLLIFMFVVAVVSLLCCSRFVLFFSAGDQTLFSPSPSVESNFSFLHLSLSCPLVLSILIVMT